MRRPRTSRIAAAAAAAGLVTVLGAPAAVAQTAEYNGGTDTGVLGNVKTTTTTGTTTARPAGRTASTTSTLPFTGGEVTLLALAGAGAVAAGAAMVVGGRRRAGATG